MRTAPDSATTLGEAVEGKIVHSEAASLTPSAIIDRRPLSRFQAGIVALCALVIVLDGFDTQCIGFLAPPIAKTLNLPLKAFGPVFAFGLIGLMISSMTMGPIADLLGRRWPLVISTLTFGVFAFLTSRVTSFDQLVVCRFLTGLGLGGALPNAFALAAEYVPRRLIAMSATAISAGMPMGALLAGLISSVMLPRWGWQSIFYVGGILPLAVALVLVAALPESVRFLAERNAEPRAIAQIMARIAPDLAAAPERILASRTGPRKDVPVKDLFIEGRAPGTILLWVLYVLNLLVLFFIVSWLPALLRQNGMPVSAGVEAITVFSLGGIIGSVGQGPLMKGFGSSYAMLGAFLISTVCIGLLAFSATSLVMMLALVFLVGCFVQGAQAGLNALVVGFYPTAMRSTGMGWASAIGRIGSVFGPVLGAVLLSMAWNTRQIFLSAAVPALAASIAVLLSYRLRGNSAIFSRAGDLNALCSKIKEAAE